MMIADDMYSRDRIESVRSRFLNKVVRCNLLGAALRPMVTEVSDDGRVEVQCSPLGFAPFTTSTNVNIAYILFRLPEEADMGVQDTNVPSSEGR